MVLVQKISPHRLAEPEPQAYILTTASAKRYCMSLLRHALPMLTTLQRTVYDPVRDQHTIDILSELAVNRPHSRDGTHSGSERDDA